MKTEEKKKMKEKLEFFYSENCKVHISKTDKMFWNGFIVGRKTEDVFILNEDRLGEVFLFVEDIYKISQCKVRDGK